MLHNKNYEVLIARHKLR